MKRATAVRMVLIVSLQTVYYNLYTVSNDLTIAQLAGATGVSSATLRAWEERHDFPGRGASTAGTVATPLPTWTRYGRSSPSARPARRSAARSTASWPGRPCSATPYSPRFGATEDWSCRRSRSRRWSRSATRSRTSCRSAPSPGCSWAHSRSGEFFARAEPRWRTLARGARLTVAFADSRAPRATARSARPVCRSPSARRSSASGPSSTSRHVHPPFSSVDSCRTPTGGRRRASRWSGASDPRVAHGVVAHAARLAQPAAPGVAAPAPHSARRGAGGKRRRVLRDRAHRPGASPGCSTRGSPRMRVAVTGSSGLIGPALVTALRAAGHDVLRLVRREPGQRTRAWDPAAGAIDDAALHGVSDRRTRRREHRAAINQRRSVAFATRAWTARGCSRSVVSRLDTRRRCSSPRRWATTGSAATRS